MKTENSLPMCDFPDFVILEYASGGAEFAFVLPENARKYCVAAARFFRSGRTKTAKDIFICVLKHAVPPSLAKKFKYFTVPELAHLAAYLLDAKFTENKAPEETFSDSAFEKSMQRLLEKIR